MRTLRWWTVLGNGHLSVAVVAAGCGSHGQRGLANMRESCGIASPMWRAKLTCGIQEESWGHGLTLPCRTTTYSLFPVNIRRMPYVSRLVSGTYC